MRCYTEKHCPGLQADPRRRKLYGQRPIVASLRVVKKTLFRSVGISSPLLLLCSLILVFATIQHRSNKILVMHPTRYFSGVGDKQRIITSIFHTSILLESRRSTIHLIGPIRCSSQWRGAAEVFRHLHETKKKKLIVLSDTSAPDKNRALAKLGFSADYFGGVCRITSRKSRFVCMAVLRNQSKHFTWDTFKPNNRRLSFTPENFFGAMREWASGD
jgi:hypothetical protein